MPCSAARRTFGAASCTWRMRKLSVALSVACCRLHVACCMLSVARCLLHVVCCTLSVACCLLHVVFCTLSVACCLLHGMPHVVAGRICTTVGDGRSTWTTNSWRPPSSLWCVRMRTHTARRSACTHSLTACGWYSEYSHRATSVRRRRSHRSASLAHCMRMVLGVLTPGHFRPPPAQSSVCPHSPTACGWYSEYSHRATSVRHGAVIGLPSLAHCLRLAAASAALVAS
jgi:hypothetical protein